MMKQRLLIVDDEEMNLDILRDYLEDEGYEVIGATNGEEAWELLEKTPDIAMILLDRMMPKMDGMEFMARLNKSKRFRDIPVVMQTAASSSQEILEGLRAGVFYYLTKPFEREIIVNVIKAALENFRNLPEQLVSSPQEQHGMELISFCELHFVTMEEAERACQFASQLFPDPARVLIGLCELAYNAVEHGNLEITYEEKNQLILEGRLKAEIQARLANPIYRNRLASIRVERTENGTQAIINDMGTGFHHEAFVNLDPLKVTKLNGRGIAIARLMSFDTMEYNAKGNEVACFCHAEPEAATASQSQAPAA